jgi:hypothetical protein
MKAHLCSLSGIRATLFLAALVGTEARTAQPSGTVFAWGAMTLPNFEPGTLAHRAGALTQSLHPGFELDK